MQYSQFLFLCRKEGSFEEQGWQRSSRITLHMLALISLYLGSCVGAEEPNKCFMGHTNHFACIVFLFVSQYLVLLLLAILSLLSWRYWLLTTQGSKMCCVCSAPFAPVSHINMAMLYFAPVTLRCCCVPIILHECLDNNTVCMKKYLLMQGKIITFTSRGAFQERLRNRDYAEKPEWSIMCCPHANRLLAYACNIWLPPSQMTAEETGLLLTHLPTFREQCHLLHFWDQFLIPQGDESMNDNSRD